MYGVHSSSSVVSMRIRRVLACPRRPSRMKLWRDRTALTTCGTTVSSYPTMPGNSGFAALHLADQILAQFVFDAAADQFGLGKGTGAKRAEGTG